ncbi:hypothetical protein AMTRI_Chr11g95020 [Amborella trichopoda]
MISKVQINRDLGKYLLPKYKSIIMIGIGIMLASSDKYQLFHSMLNESRAKAMSFTNNCTFIA